MTDPYFYDDLRDDDYDLRDLRDDDDLRDDRYDVQEWEDSYDDGPDWEDQYDDAPEFDEEDYASDALATLDDWDDAVDIVLPKQESKAPCWASAGFRERGHRRHTRRHFADGLNRRQGKHLTLRDHRRTHFVPVDHDDESVVMQDWLRDDLQAEREGVEDYEQDYDEALVAFF